MAMTNINVRADQQVKEAAEELFSSLGLNMSTAINVFLRQAIRVKGLPFEVLAEEANQADAISTAKMRTRAASVPAVREAVTAVANSYPEIQRIYLFGSFARNTFTDTSDIDLRLIIDGGSPFSLIDLARFSVEIEQLTGRDVDAVTAREIKNIKLKEAIEKDKVLIYERKEQ